MSSIKTFGDVDARSLEQLERCMAAGDADFGVLCADHHPGYSQRFSWSRLRWSTVPNVLIVLISLPPFSMSWMPAR